jgi:hypothetical protein
MPKQERTALVFRPDEKLAGEIKEAFLWKYGFAGLENLPVKSSATGLMRPHEQAVLVEAEDGGLNKTFDADETATGKADFFKHILRQNRQLNFGGRCRRSVRRKR